MAEFPQTIKFTTDIPTLEGVYLYRSHERFAPVFLYFWPEQKLFIPCTPVKGYVQHMFIKEIPEGAEFAHIYKVENNESSA